MSRATLATVERDGDRVYATTSAGGDKVVLTTQADTLVNGIRVGDLNVNDALVATGDTVRLGLPLENTESTDTDITVEFIRDGSVYKTTTVTVPGDGQINPGDSESFSTPGTRDYESDPGDNTVPVTWFGAIRPGFLSASPQALRPGETSTLSIDVTNTGSDDVAVSVDFRSLSGGVEASDSTVVPGGSTATLSGDVTRQSETTVPFVADVTNEDAGITGTSNSIRVLWADLDDVPSFTLQIGDSEMRSEDTAFDFNNGTAIPAGDYLLEATGTGWSHNAAGPSLDFKTKETRFEDATNTDTTYAVVTGDTAELGPALLYPGATFETGGGAGVYQEWLWSRGGTFTLDTDSVVSFYNMDEPGTYGDNGADLTWTLYQLP